MCNFFNAIIEGGGGGGGIPTACQFNKMTEHQDFITSRPVLALDITILQRIG